MAPRFRQLPCIYCGETGDGAPDHVPPKALFAPPRPSDLQTVPSCRTCNGAFQRDDEYVRATLAFRINRQMSQPAVSVRALTLRGLARPEATGFARSVFGNLVAAGPAAPDGTITLTGQWIDNDRVGRFVARLTRAFFFVERSRPLANRHRVRGGLLEVISPFLQPLLPMLGAGGGWGVRANDQFEYIWGEAGDDPDTTVWLFTLFDRFSFVGLTGPPKA